MKQLANTANKKDQMTGTQIHKVLETEEFKAETVTQEFKIALQQARCEKKLTQQQLANV